ncbi:MAG: glycosyltransferase family 2 protein [Verrucomicrobiota bacterium]
MSSPEISVLMPTYNYASYLPEAIASVLSQDFQDFELLIVDDASTDNTVEVVNPFCVRDARVRLTVNSANLGMVNNWNNCLKEARGKYIKYLFGDDKLSDPQALTKLITLLRNNPGATLAASARAILDEKSNMTGIWRPLPDGCHNGRKVISACLIENGNMVGEPSSVLFRKADVQRGFDPRFRQIVDIEMWFHLLEQGDLAYTREPLCAYRLHARQQSAVNDNEGVAWKEHLLFFSRYATKPGFSRQARFSALFALRRSRQKKPGPFHAELLDTEHRLASQLGGIWYALHWIWYRLTIPLRNLRRSMEKALIRARLSRRPGRKDITQP